VFKVVKPAKGIEKLTEGFAVQTEGKGIDCKIAPVLILA
jgi:hypothetical protein